MSWNPSLIFYACVAKGITILAEFNSKDADLGELAKKCLDKTPQLHSSFFHTVHGKTYMFLIQDPFVYFGIFDENLDKTECLSFLKGVKDSFALVTDNCTSENVKKRLDSMNSHCFQGDFNPVFHQLLASNSEFDMIMSPAVLKDHNGLDNGLDSARGAKIGTMPLLRDLSPKGLKLKLKKKRFFWGDNNKGGLKEKKLDVLSDDDLSISGGVLGGPNDSSRLQKAKHVWKKQLVVVLSMDFVVCLILFAAWLWVCSGFQCIAN